MNKTKIGWTDRTWSPITGCTKHCNYCYARRLANGRLKERYLSNPNVAPERDPNDPFSPRFWRNRLDDPSKATMPLKIFTCSMGELFDPYVPDDWIKQILSVAQTARWQTFQFLTKQPQRAAQFTFPLNAWVGVTIEHFNDECRERMTQMYLIKAPVRFISFEPLTGPVNHIPSWINWVIIGAMAGPGPIKPEKWWVEQLIYLADTLGIPVFLKSNLNWPVKRQEFPQ